LFARPDRVEGNPVLSGARFNLICSYVFVAITGLVSPPLSANLRALHSYLGQCKISIKSFVCRTYEKTWGYPCCGACIRISGRVLVGLALWCRLYFALCALCRVQTLGVTLFRSDMTATTAIASRISRRFAELRVSGEMGIVAYITAGDPSIPATLKFALALAEAGADVIELGVPFSDPLADGPTIQRASERALKAGTTLQCVLNLVHDIRKSSQVPLVLFTYYNPIFQMGLEKFASAASSAGADGVLVTDLTPEEADDHLCLMRSHQLDTIFLAAPTSDDERLQRISAASSGFLYLISRTGVTGAKDALPDDLPSLLRRIRQFTNLPVAVGFGISLPGHVSVLGGLADAAVVGSALVAEIEKATAQDPSPRAIESAADALSGKTRSLKEAARAGLSRRDPTRKHEVAP